MSTFDFSSSPLSTLLSPAQTGFDSFSYGMGLLNPSNNSLVNLSQDLATRAQNIVNSTKTNVGLSLAGSTDPSAQFLGKQWAREGIDNTLNKTTNVVPIRDFSFNQKFANSTFGKNYNLWSAGLDTANNIFTSIAGEKDEYEGKYGSITRGIDKAYDTIQNVAGMIPGVGQAASLIMGANKLLGNVANKLGGGTDGMSKTDAVLGSAFFQLTPFGLVNGFGGRNSRTITKNDRAFETVGSSYTGSSQTVDDALQESGKKYGLFSGSARGGANARILEAQRQQNLIEDISDTALDRRAIRDSMAAINGNRRQYQLQGGYNQANVRVGKNGMNIELLNKARQIARQSKRLQIGGVISDPFEVYLQSLPQAQRDSTNFRVRDYWEYNGRPKNFDEARKKGMFEWKEDFDESGKSLGWSWHAFTVAKNPSADEYDFMKSSSHPTVQKEIDWYNSDAGSEFRKEYELQKVQPYYKYVKRKAPYKDVSVHKGGGSIIELISLPTEILLVDPNEIPEFQEGGSINVIPDGALHARKHNMDMEGITKKGIPVVSENKDGSVEQQAEIEREEIIYRLEVTKELERLSKIYYDKDSSSDDKENVALQAGKLLVEETLYNTKDNTGLLKET